MTVLSRMPTNRWRRTASALLIIVAALTIAACGGRETDQPTTVPTATAAAVALQPPATQPPATPTPAATATPSPTATDTPLPTATPTATATPIHPLSIEYLRQQTYPGSQLIIEQTLAPGSNYDRYYASYDSEGLKQYGLLTVPRGQKPDSGWPVIIFNHGFIPPNEYRTTERYVAYVAGFASSGYIVFRPDYRGHDRSEGSPTGAYGSPDYVIDVLNAAASLKQYPDADPQRIGMWGHSMGGWITLRAMVTDPDIQAGVIWGGVVGAYEDLLTGWRRGDRPPPTPDPNGTRGRWRNSLTSLFGSPESNPEFWQSLSANYFLDDLSGPIQLHHTRGDEFGAGGILGNSLSPGAGRGHAHRTGHLSGRQPQHLRQLRRGHEPVGSVLRPLAEAAAEPARHATVPPSLPAAGWPTCAAGRARRSTSWGRCRPAKACPSPAATPTAPGGRCRRPTVLRGWPTA